MVGAGALLGILGCHLFVAAVVIVVVVIAMAEMAVGHLANRGRHKHRLGHLLGIDRRCHSGARPVRWHHGRYLRWLLKLIGRMRSVQNMVYIHRVEFLRDL